MALAFVQLVGGSVSSGTTYAITISPTAGNALVLTHAQTTGAIRSVVVSDNIDGTTGWVQSSWYNPSLGVGVWSKANIPAGITTVTATFAGSGVNASGIASEYSGFGATITLDASDTLTEGGALNNHTSSAAGVTSANECLALAVGALSAAATLTVAGVSPTAYTALKTSTNQLHEYFIFAAGCTNELGKYSNTGTARIGTSTIVLLSGSGGGGGPVGHPTVRRFGGIPHMGQGGSAGKGLGPGMGRMWGRERGKELYQAR